MNTYPEQINEQIDAYVDSIEEARNEIASAERRIRQLERQLETARLCPSCDDDSVNHFDESVGWCEDCGRVYALDTCRDAIKWVDPLTASLGDFNATEKQARALAAIWDNEAARDRREA